MKYLLVITLLAFGHLTAFGQKLSGTVLPSFPLKAIPYPCQVIDTPADIRVLSENALQLTASAGTDLHNPASGVFQKSNAPKFLFSPAGDFDFAAKVSPSHQNLYDGGALLIWTDAGNWAKVLLQNTGDKSLLGLSVVRDSITDDSYFLVGDAREVYMRLVRKGPVCTFYFSLDGQAWTVLRQFVYHRPAQMQVGFYAQSPKGPACQVTFSEIKFVAAK